MSKLYVKNEFGETYSTAESIQQIADASPAKTGVEAIVAIADPSTASAEVCADKINEILAALKVVV